MGLVPTTSRGSTSGSGTGFNAITAKAADTSRNTTTTLTADPDLTWAISGSATEIWLFELFLIINGANATMDSKFGLSAPAGATALWGPHDNGVVQPGWNPLTIGQGTPGNTLTIADIFNASTGATNATTVLVYVGGWLFGGGTSGTVALTWAQNTSDGGALILKKGSTLRTTKLAA